VVTKRYRVINKTLRAAGLTGCLCIGLIGASKIGGIAVSTTVLNAVQAFFIVLLVDLVGGAVHWAEDTFGTENTPIFGTWLIKPNILHHTPHGANAFLNNHWLYSSWDLFTAAPIVLGVSAALGVLTWQVWLFVLVGAMSQQVHRISHTPVSKLPKFVRLLQLTCIIQDGPHHWSHHGNDKNTGYCVVTPFLNPLLDRIKFWRGLERILVPFFGAPRRQDLRDESWYPVNLLLRK